MDVLHWLHFQEWFSALGWCCLDKVVAVCLRVVHKRRLQKVLVCLPLPVRLCLIAPLQTSTFIIIHLSRVVWQCNSWFSQNALLIDLIITDYCVLFKINGRCVFVRLINNTSIIIDDVRNAAVEQQQCIIVYCSLLSRRLQGIISLALHLHG